VQEATETRAPGGNRPDLSDRQECRREIYRLAPISAANSGGGHRNQARRRRGDTVARAGERKEKRWARGSDRSVWPSHLVGFDQVGWRRQVGQAWQVGLRGFLTKFKNRNWIENKGVFGKTF
jgi:hypothetical protein